MPARRPATPELRAPSILLFALAGTLLVLSATTVHAGMIGSGLGPHSVEIADLNEDGWADLISGNTTDSTVTVSLGRGNGTCEPKVQYGCGGPVSGIAVADFNKDGHLDVVCCSQSLGKVGVRFGDGTGSLGARTDYTVTGPADVTVGDVDEDTFPDIITGNWTASSIGILRYAGAGSFGPAGYLTGIGATRIAVGDLNNDNHLDIVGCALISSSVSVWLGSGIGTFSGPTHHATNDIPVDVTLADFNLDGKRDLAAAVRNTQSVNVRLGNGDGTFAPSTVVNVAADVTSIASGDFNADTKPDLAVVSSQQNRVSVFVGSGSGTFLPRVDYPAGLGADGIVTGNLDIDGNVDLMIAAPSQNSICTLPGNGDGTFQTPSGTVYVFNYSTSPGGFDDPNAWRPVRNTPLASDVLVFNRGGGFGVLGVSGTVGQITVSGGSSPSFSATGFGTSSVTVAGGTGTDFVVERSSVLNLTSFVSPVQVGIAAGANAQIDGDVMLAATNNRLQAQSTSGIIFQSTGRAFIEPSVTSTTTPFGDGTGASGLNSVRFLYGSQCIANTSYSVFGTAAPNAVVVFGPGSRFRQNVAFSPDASGRTYGDYEYNVASTTSTMSGSGAFQVDSLIVTQGTLVVGMTGPVTIRGNISTPACSTANQLLFLPATPATYKLGGSSRQQIHGPVGCNNVLRIYSSSNVTFDIDNPAGVDFSQGWRTVSNFHFTHGNVYSTPGWQTIPDSAATITNASQSTGWFVNPLARRIAADGIVRIDVGDSANYLPIDVNAHGTTNPGYIIGSTYAQDFLPVENAQLDLAHRLHRVWLVQGSDSPFNTLPVTFLSGLDATFGFLSSDFDPGSDPLQFEARAYGINPDWIAPILGTRTANSIQVLGLAPATLRDHISHTAGQSITPSLSVVNASESEGNGAAQGAEPPQSMSADHSSSSIVGVPSVASDGEIVRAFMLGGSGTGHRQVQPMRAQTAGSLAFRVRLSQAAVSPISVDYQTEDGTATVADGDYTPVSGTLNFAPGDTALDVIVPFGVDATPEFNETFGLTLSNPTGDVTIGTGTATGTIVDDDDVTPPTATVTYPNGGELILQQQQVNLTWNATDDFTVNGVDLFIVRGASAETLAIGYPNTGSYSWTAAGAASNKVRFRVVAHDVNHATIDNSNANWELSAFTIGVGDAPVAFALPPVAPNPATAGPTRIAFAVPRESAVKLTVHDIQGRTVAKLADGTVPAGMHERTWNASRASTGVYFVRFEAPGFHAERRLVVVR